MLNKIVIRFADGKIMKGTTEDFFPNKEIFHLNNKENGEYHEIKVRDLKAVFFVKSFEGSSGYKDTNDVERVGLGRKIRVQFKDGEIIVGYTQGFSPNRAGFIVSPADPDCNNERVFIVNAATEIVHFI
jgi:hypothetical protein